MNKPSRWTRRGAMVMLAFIVACAVLVLLAFWDMFLFNHSSGDTAAEPTAQPTANPHPALDSISSSPFFTDTAGLTGTDGLAPGVDQPGFGASEVAELRQRLQREELAAGPLVLSGSEIRTLTVVVTPSAELLPDSARAIAAARAIYTTAHHLVQIGLSRGPTGYLRSVTFVIRDRNGATLGAVDVGTAEMRRWYESGITDRDFRCSWSGTPELIDCPVWVRN